jgi:hypothetical protein
MEVWILEEYSLEDGTTNILGVFENADVGLRKVDNGVWTQYDTYYRSNEVNDMIHYLEKFEVILDEIPIKKEINENK